MAKITRKLRDGCLTSNCTWIAPGYHCTVLYKYESDVKTSTTRCKMRKKLNFAPFMFQHRALKNGKFGRLLLFKWRGYQSKVLTIPRPEKPRQCYDYFVSKSSIYHVMMFCAKQLALTSFNRFNFCTFFLQINIDKDM